MYKSGKNWVVVTLSAAALVAGIVGGQANVSADETTDANSSVISQNIEITNSSTQQDSSNQVVLNTPSTATENTAQDNNSSTAAPDTAAKTATTNQDDTTNAPSTKSAAVSSSQVSPKAEGQSQVNESSQLNKKAAEVVAKAGVDANKLTADQIKELNKINFSQSSQSGTKMTFHDLTEIGNAIIKKDIRYAVPYFNASQIKNMPAAVTRDAQTGQIAKLDIWDSWPVQDAVTGYVSNYHGYQLVIAMMGIPNENDNHIYLLYNKYGDNDFSHWRNAGSIFGYNEKSDLQEWSGSAIVNNDGSIQLFYTVNDTSNGKINDQQLATATLHLDVNSEGVMIKNVTDNHIIFQGDGVHYQTYQQFVSGAGMRNDDYCLRDGHVVQLENGDRYLVFEGNTGSENYQDENQIYNWSNYGGDDAFNLKSFFKLLNNKNDNMLASLANGALGILKLTNDQTNPQVETVYSPLITSLMVSDELERPDIVKLGDKYYLFSATRVSRGSDTELTSADNKAVGDNVAMIGYVADSLLGTYTPLNGSGVVLTASVPSNWRTSTYSYYAVPVNGHSDQILITSYMTNRGFAAGEGNYSTWAPSYLVQINSDNTTQVLARMTNQGDWIWDNSSNNDEMFGVLDPNAKNSAALPGEWGQLTTPVNPSEPSQPTTPVNPSNPTTPVSPSEPSQPTTPVNPSNPTTPVNPSEPSQPTTPVNPSNPTTPVNPSEPSQPTTPVNPSNPTTPVNPSEPSQPTTPVNPSNPTTPVNPSEPSQPTTPVNPSNPTTPVTPSEPSQPTTPVSPSNPTTPVTPNTPSQPTNPVQPSTPALPKTGNDNSAAAMGLVAAAFLGMFGLTEKKRRY